MSLYTSEGLAMIDTENVVQFQAKNDLHRLFAPGVIESHRAPMTKAERVLLVLIYAASLAIVCMVLGWGYQELKNIDWSAVVELLGVMR